MSESTKKAAEFWSDPGRDVPGTQWLQIPGAVENMNLPGYRRSGNGLDHPFGSSIG